MTIKNYASKKHFQTGGSNGTYKIKDSRFSIASNPGSIGKFAKRVSARIGMSGTDYDEYKKQQLRTEIKEKTGAGADWDKLDKFMQDTQKKANARKLLILQKQKTWLGRNLGIDVQQQQLDKVHAIQTHYDKKKIAEVERVIGVAERRASLQGIDLASRPVIPEGTDISNRFAILKSYADDIRKRIASHHLAENTRRYQEVMNARQQFIDALAPRSEYMHKSSLIQLLGNKLRTTKNADEAMRIKTRLVVLSKEKQELKKQVKAITGDELRILRDNWKRMQKEYGKTTLSGRRAKLERLEKGIAKPADMNYEPLISRRGYKTTKRIIKTNKITNANKPFLEKRERAISNLNILTYSKLKTIPVARFTTKILEKLPTKYLEDSIEMFNLLGNDYKPYEKVFREELLRRQQK